MPCASANFLHYDALELRAEIGPRKVVYIMARKGICVAGNAIVDITYPIDVMPSSGQLVPITGGAIRTTGGALSNVIVDLAILDPTMPLKAIGRIGKDAEGELTKKVFGRYPNIDTSGMIEEGTTSFTLVFSENITKQRTFFTFGGAGDSFSEADFNWDTIDSEILHIGYILLLKELDKTDDEYGTKMARLLASAKAHGLKTSIDVVTESGDRFKKLVPPALKYTDYCVINESETQEITGVELRDSQGVLHPENMEAALDALFAMGVSTWCVIHCPEGGWGKDSEGMFHHLPSLKLPAGYIKGTVGAGDAYCSGVLLAAEKGESLDRGLLYGTAAASMTLREPGATEGMDTIEKALENYRAILGK